MLVYKYWHKYEPVERALITVFCDVVYDVMPPHATNVDTCSFSSKTFIKNTTKRYQSRTYSKPMGKDLCWRTLKRHARKTKWIFVVSNQKVEKYIIFVHKAR